MTMIDLRERFEDADLILVPDLWASVEVKITEQPDPVERRPRLVRYGGSPSTRRVLTRKALTIAAALLIAVVAIGLVMRAFRSQTVPLEQPPTGIFAPVRGWIASVDSSQRLVANDPTSSQPPVVLPGRGLPIAWSPEGTHLLLQDGSVLNADGTITHLAIHAAGIGGGTFSPDGTRIVYWGPDANIYVLRDQASWHFPPGPQTAPRSRT